MRVITSSELVGGKGHDPSGNLEPGRRDGGGRREAPIQEQRLVFHEIFQGKCLGFAVNCVKTVAKSGFVSMIFATRGEIHLGTYLAQEGTSGRILP